MTVSRHNWFHGSDPNSEPIEDEISVQVHSMYAVVEPASCEVFECRVYFLFVVCLCM